MSMRKSAVMSADGLYRYTLTRQWGDDDKKMVAFIGLNPSTADHATDDPTIRRCYHFAKKVGATGMVVVNLFAYRATKPKEMKQAEDPVGPDNNHHIFTEANKCAIRIAIWGANGGYLKRDRRVLHDLKGPVFCLGVTKHGKPKHPLYLENATKLMVLKK